MYSFDKFVLVLFSFFLAKFVTTISDYFKEKLLLTLASDFDTKPAISKIGMQFRRR